MKKTTLRVKWSLVWLWCLGMGIWAGSAYSAAADAPNPCWTDPWAANNCLLLEKQVDAVTTIEMAIGLSSGLRYDRLNWSIAGTADGHHPNVLSELTWTNVYSRQLVISGHLTVGSVLYGRGSAGYAEINSGQVRDSDYDGDDRTYEYSRSISQTNGDQMWDVSLGAGPAFSLRQGRLFLAPLFGYSLHWQHLRITEGRQVLASPPRTPELGPLDDRLNSLYSTQWSGPWLGADLRFMIPQRSGQVANELGLSLEYHFACDYTAEADWNLRGNLQHPVSFRHKARGEGVLISGLWVIQLHPRVGINFGLQYQKWTTSPGVNRLYLSNGETRKSRLNEVSWESTSLLFGAVLRF